MATKPKETKSRAEQKETKSFGEQCRHVVLAMIALTAFIAGFLKVSDIVDEFFRGDAKPAERYFALSFVNESGGPAQEIIVASRGKRFLANESGYVDLPLAVLESPLEVYFDGMVGHVETRHARQGDDSRGTQARDEHRPNVRASRPLFLWVEPRDSQSTTPSEDLMVSDRGN